MVILIKIVRWGVKMLLNFGYSQEAIYLFNKFCLLMKTKQTKILLV